MPKSSDLRLTSKRIQPRCEIRTPPLKDGLKYHAFLVYSSKDIAWVKDLMKVLERRYKLKCALSDRDFEPGAYIVDNIHNFINQSRRILLIMTENFLKSQWVDFEVHQSLHSSLSKNKDIIIPLLVGIDEDRLPPQLSCLNYVLAASPDKEFFERLLRFLTCEDDRNMSLVSRIPIGQIGQGFAWSYYYGYLALILPGMRERIIKSKWWHSNPAKRRIATKLIICIPESGFCRSTLTEADSRVVHTGKLAEFKANRAGNVRRTYCNNVYQVTNRNGEVYYLAAEFASPVLTLYEMEREKIAGLPTKDKQYQIQLFCETLEGILTHQDAGKCAGAYYLFRYNDKPEGIKYYPLADELVKRIKQEIKNENGTIQMSAAVSQSSFGVSDSCWWGFIAFIKLLLLPVLVGILTFYTFEHFKYFY